MERSAYVNEVVEYKTAVKMIQHSDYRSPFSLRRIGLVTKQCFSLAMENSNSELDAL